MKSFAFWLAFLLIFGGFPALAAPGQRSVAGNAALAETGSNVYTAPDTSGLSLYTLGVRKPDGICYVTEKYAKTLDDAMASVAKTCKSCTVDDITGNSYLPGAPDFREFCQTPPGRY